MAEKEKKNDKDMRPESVYLDDIDASAKIRTYVNEDDLEELKDSIEKIGLLQPIVVMERQEVKAGEKRYVLVAGYRRLLAHRKLGRPQILAMVVSEKDEKKVLALSLAENLCRAQLNRKDTAEAVSRLYGLYGGDVKKIARTTGMWPETVRRYLLLNECGSKKMIQLVDDELVSLSDAKRALQAASWDVPKAEGYVQTMVDEGMTRIQKKRFVNYVQSDPRATIQKAVEEAKRQKIERAISVDLTSEVRGALEKAAMEWEMKAEEIAAQALEEWLEAEGYLERKARRESRSAS